MPVTNKRKPTSYRLGPRTLELIEAIQSEFNWTATQVIRRSVDEFATLCRIKLPKKSQKNSRNHG